MANGFVRAVWKADTPATQTVGYHVRQRTGLAMTSRQSASTASIWDDQHPADESAGARTRAGRGPVGKAVSALILAALLICAMTAVFVSAFLAQVPRALPFGLIIGIFDRIRREADTKIPGVSREAEAAAASIPASVAAA